MPIRWLLAGLLACFLAGCGDVGRRDAKAGHAPRSERHDKRHHRTGARPAPRPAHPQRRFRRATVSRVIDGDTIEVVVAGAERDVRVIGIDTPETHRPGTPVECGGRDASAHMQRLLTPGEPVRLTEDPTQDRVDRYGRLLRYVSAGGRDVGLAQVRSGWAEVYVYDGNPFRRTARYRRAAAAGRNARRGVWRECGGDFHSAASTPAKAVTRAGGSGCDPNYTGACLKPDAEDYDCRGGAGDGPEYTGPVRVAGDDHYGLDTDGDGTACEGD